MFCRTNPRAVFLENVENLVLHDHGNTIETIIKTLEDELRYRVIGVSLDDDGNYVYNRSSLVRNSKDFGVPQNRPRVYLMAFSKKIYGNAVKLLTKSLPTSGNKIIFRDVNEILEPVVEDRYYMAQGYLETLKRHKARQKKNGYGFGYCVVNQTKSEHPLAYTILATGGSGKERNLIYQPKEGVAGKVIPEKQTPLNAEGIRFMTPTEWGRLQGFIGYAFLDENGKEKFEFPNEITDGYKYKQFGNSVTIPVIETMANFMLECFGVLEKQQVDVVRAIADNNSCFSKRDVMEILDLNSAQAGYLLRTMVDSGEILKFSRGKSTRYAKYADRLILPPVSNEDKVLTMFETRSIITNSDITKELNLKVSTTNVLLSNMVKKGLLKRLARDVLKEYTGLLKTGRILLEAIK